MTDALAKIDAAKTALAEAKSLQEILEIRDRATAMHAYAVAKGAGEAANQAKEIELRARRCAGEFLDGMDKHPGGRPSKTCNGSLQVSPPVLPDLGITRMQASRWQTEAKLPEEDFEQYIAKTKASGAELTSAAVYKRAQKHRRKQEHEQKEDEGLISLPLHIKDRYALFCGDFENDSFNIEPGSIDTIITDPPYPEEYLYLYGVLAKKAADLLKPGGSLLAMVGQSYLPEVFNLMTPHIRYNWIVAYLTPGGQSAQLWQRKVNTFWKPVLWFVKGEYQGDWIGDVAKSDVNDNDKRFHNWGQSESGMAHLIEMFTHSGDLILDPFCGGGTTGVVAITRNRRFIGIDVDERAILTTAERINEQCQMLSKNGRDGAIFD